MSFKKHTCSFGLDSSSTLPKHEQASCFSRICRALRKQILVSDQHPLAYKYFRSYPALVAERQRQLVEGQINLFHPLSLFSLIWRNIMTIVNITHMVVSSLRISYVATPPSEPIIHDLDYILLVLHILCLLDILVKFNTGACSEGTPPSIVLDRRDIACKYLRRWFIVELISSLPCSFTLLLLGCRNSHCYLILHFLPLLKAAQLPCIMADAKIFMKTITRSYIWHRSLCHSLLFGLTMHWFACAIYLPPIINYYWLGYIPEGYNHFLNTREERRNITQLSFSHRYQKAMFISVSAFFGTGFSMFTVWRPDEILLNSVIILSATMYLIYTVVFFLKIYMMKFNSELRYEELMNQVEKYMRHKQFPAPLKKRVLAFYEYRYQERYFKEEAVFDCLSEQLRNEITLHTCHKLVSKVSLFASLPATLVGTLLGCLKAEVFLPNDLVVRAGDIGDCMYFIASGTVAVYSMKGAEVSHLEDGDFFGAVALLMKDCKRVASVVAIEITQVYRLDREDFRSYIMTNQELFSRIEALASKHMNETVLLDDAFSREREIRNEHMFENAQLTNKNSDD